MSCEPAPACKAVLAQATARWPARSRASDGVCPSAAHTAANPTSDHELGLAADLTHDPLHGCDAHAEVRKMAARRDPRVKYIISRGEIWNPLIGAGPAYKAQRRGGAGRLRALLGATPGWRPYSGIDPHTHHAHISIRADARNDTSLWFGPPPLPVPPPLPTPVPWEADMPKPNDFTSACVDPVTGGHWEQTAEGGVAGHDGAFVHGSYKDHPDLGGSVRYFTAIIPSGKGGYVQISNDGKRYQWDPKS